MKKIIASLSLFICILAPLTQVQADSYEVSVTDPLAINRNLIGELFGGSTSAFIEDSSKQELVIKNEKPIAVTVEIYDKYGTLLKSMIVPPMLDGKINKAKALLLESPISTIKGFVNEGFLENHTKTGFNIENLPEDGSIKFIRGESDAIAITAVATAINSFDAFGELLGADKSSALLVALYENAIKDPALISDLAITINDSSIDANKKAKQITSIVANFIGTETIKIVEKASWKLAFGGNSPAVSKGLKLATKSITVLASLEKAGASLAMASNMTRDLSRGKLTMTQQGFNNTNPDTSYGESITKKEVGTAIPKPTQAELAAKAQKQLKIAAKISDNVSSVESLARQQLSLAEDRKKAGRKLQVLESSRQEYNRLLSDEQSLDSRLRNIENTISNSKNIQSISQEKIDAANEKVEAYRYALNLNNKYDGDMSRLTGREKVGLYIRSKNVFGHVKFYDVLFLSARSRLTALENQLARVNSAEHNLDNLYAEKKTIERQLATVRNHLDDYGGIESTIRDQRKYFDSLSQQINEERTTLTDLVSDNNDLEKQAQAIGFAEVANGCEIEYDGYMANSFGSGGANTPCACGDPDEESTPSYIGMNLNPHTDNSVYTGEFLISTMHNTDSSGEYNYLSWGRWDVTDPPQLSVEANGNVNEFVGGNWLRVQEACDIPRQGSASYVGQVTGDYGSNATGYLSGAISGSVVLNANFGASTISGQLNLLKNGAAWLNPTLTNGTIDEEDFDANLSGVADGGISGTFAGPNGQIPVETGGSWWVRETNSGGGDPAAVGTFRAKKQ